MHVHDLVPYLQGGTKHDFGHKINRFSFGSETEAEFKGVGGVGAEQTKRSLGIVDPLEGISAHTEESNYMFQYFVKVVSTQFGFLDGRELKTHQYSVTQYERDRKSCPLRRSTGFSPWLTTSSRTSSSERQDTRWQGRPGPPDHARLRRCARLVCVLRLVPTQRHRRAFSAQLTAIGR